MSTETVAPGALGCARIRPCPVYPKGGSVRRCSTDPAGTEERNFAFGAMGVVRPDEMFDAPNVKVAVSLDLDPVLVRRRGKA